MYPNVVLVIIVLSALRPPPGHHLWQWWPCFGLGLSICGSPDPSPSPPQPPTIPCWARSAFLLGQGSARQQQRYQTLCTYGFCSFMGLGSSQIMFMF